MAFHPYLNFAGSCREAFTRYQEIFGGELEIIGAGDLPPGEDTPPDWDPELVIHAALIFEDHLLMASDDPAMHGPVQNMYVNWDTDDVDAARRAFAELCEGGEVEMEVQETFWSPAFGICRDRFGTPWMISAAGPRDG